MSKRGHIPIRTCAGCGVRSPRAEMRRLGFGPNGEGLEWRARMGRGTYLHVDDPQCLRRFAEGRKTLLGLRKRVDREARRRLVEELPIAGLS